MAGHAQSAATKARISHTGRVRKGKVHTGVLESTLPKNPAGSKIRASTSPGPRGRISLSDLPQASQKNILLGAHSRFQRDETKRIQAGHTLQVAHVNVGNMHASHGAGSSAANRAQIAETQARASYNVSKARADESLQHVTNLSQALKPRHSNPAGTKGLTRQAAPSTSGAKAPKITPIERQMTARQRSSRVGKQTPAPTRVGKQAPAPTRVGKQSAAPRTGGGTSAGLGKKPKSSVGTHIPSPAQTSSRPKRTLTDAQKAAKAARARARRAKKKG